MNAIKNKAIKGMNKVMLDCDTATFLITKNEYVSLPCIEKMQLKLHLATCKFCRRFKKQSSFLSQIHKENILPDNDHLRLHLSEDQKNRIKKNLPLS